jgi:hypothetical protein
MASYPLVFDIAPQQTYNRVHVGIRIVIYIILAALSVIPIFRTIGWLPSGILYLGIPVAAAILISQKGGRRYLDESEQNMTMWLRWLVALGAYFGMLTDRLPTEDPKQTLRFEVTPDGEPSAGNVLFRIILAIPHAIVLGLLGIVAGILAIIAAIMVVIQEKYPEGIFTFLRGYARWSARVYAYLGGLAQAYPPFAFDTGTEGGPPIAAGVAPPPASPGAGTGATP